MARAAWPSRARGSNRRDGLRNREAVVRTCDCDSESHSVLWRRVGARETCSHDGSKAGEERKVEAEQQSGKVKRDGLHCSPGGESPSGWKHGVSVNGAQGVKEVEGQLRGPCDEPQFENLKITWAPVRSATAGGLRQWRERHRKRGSRICPTVEAEPWKVKVRFPT